MIIIFFCSASIAINGYYFGFIDHQHYLPYLNKLINPDSYSSDYYFSQPHNLYSPFNSFIILFKNIFNLEVSSTCFILYLASLWLLYFSIYYLATSIYKNYVIGIISVFLFIIPKWAAQIGYMTHHFYLVSRDLSLGLSILALAFVLRKKMIVSLIIILGAVFVNPSIPIPVGIFWLYKTFKKSFLTKKKLPAILAYNNQWLEIMRQRGTYSFPHLWHWTGWGNMILFLSLFPASWIILKKQLFGKQLKNLKRFLQICFLLFAFHFLISFVIPISFLIQLQLLRAVNFIFVLSLVIFSAALYKVISSFDWPQKLAAFPAIIAVFLWGDHLTVWHFLAIWFLPLFLIVFPSKRKKKIGNKNIVLTLILIVILNSLIHLFYIKPIIFWPYYIHYPNPLVKIDYFPDWLNVQMWAKNNSDINSVFLVPPNYGGFRSFSERGIIGDSKDGGLVFYSPAYAKEWSERMDNLSNYQTFDENKFNYLKNKYNFDYFVLTNKHHIINPLPIYKNKNFKIYKL